jgi:hypothetical protein
MLTPSSNRSGDGGLIGASASGLPCDVYALLGTYCMGCHSSPPVLGASMPLETLADLQAPGRSDPSKTVAQLCLQRMQSTASPMPPPGLSRPSAQEVMAFGAWVTAGASGGSCDSAATADGGAIMPGPNPYDTPVKCSSGVMSNIREGALMRPGDTCVSCHATSGGEAPLLSIGGTVYPSAHEPTDCNGVNVSGATVVITDAKGKVLELQVNAAGNFYATAAITTPFHAKVVYQGVERSMSAAQTSGDCNACHTQSGTMSAPGRIMLP